MTTQVYSIRELAEIPCSKCLEFGHYYEELPGQDTTCKACNRTGYKFWQLWKLCPHIECTNGEWYVAGFQPSGRDCSSCKNRNHGWVLKPEAELRVALEDYGLDQGWVIFIEHQQDGRFYVSFENLPICTEGQGYGATVLEALVQTMFSCNQKS